MVASCLSPTWHRRQGVASPRATRAPKRFPRGAALRPATCPPPPRACARPLAPITQSRGAAPFTHARGRAAHRAPCPLRAPGLAHVPPPRDASRFCTARARQNPCVPVSRRRAARRPALSMRASRRPRRRLGPWRPGLRRSQQPLPVTHVPPCATPGARGDRKAAGLTAAEGGSQGRAHPGGHEARVWAGARRQPNVAAHTGDGRGGSLAT